MANNVTIPATGSGTATPVVETIDTTAAGLGATGQRQIVSVGDRAGNAVDSIGGLTETVPGTDTASSGLNGRLQRLAQRLTNLIALLPAALTGSGNLKVAIQEGFPLTPGSSAALEGSHVLKASAGSLFSLYCQATSVTGYLMTFNATSAPVDGAVTPVECIPVSPGQVASVDFGNFPDAYSAGMVAVFSTTGPFTKTASATAFFKWRVL